MRAERRRRAAVRVPERVGQRGPGVHRLRSAAGDVGSRDRRAHAVEVDAAEVAAQRATRGDHRELHLIPGGERGTGRGDVDEGPVEPLGRIARGDAGGGVPRDSRLPGGVEARVQGRAARQVEQLDVEVGLLIERVRRVLQHRRDGEPHVDLSVVRVHVGEAHRHRLLEHVGVLVLPVRRRVLVVEPRGALSVERKPERLPGAEVGVGLRQRRPADDIRRIDAGAEPGQVEGREARWGSAPGPAHAVCVQIIEQGPTRGRRRPDRVVFEIAVGEDEVWPGSRVERKRVFLRVAPARREHAQREQRQDASTRGRRREAVAHFLSQR